MLLCELRSQLIAGKNFDGVLHARVVRENVVAALTVAEEADDAGMGAVENANDAAFGALRAVTGTRAKNFGEDVVAVHGVLNRGAGDKDVASVLGSWNVGDDEAVSVVVEDEAAGEFVAAGGRWGICAGRLGSALGGLGGLFFPF